MKTKLLTLCAVMLLVSGIVSAADVADWNAFVIRNSTVGNIAPVISDDAGGGKVFAITLGGQKAGWGTKNMDGYKLGDMKSISITRDPSVIGYGPYFNIWITNGAGKYAVIANEPSNPEWGGSAWTNITWSTLASKTVKVYENSDISWLPAKTHTVPGIGGLQWLFSDFDSFIVKAPTVAEITTGWPGLGGGAPRELGTNVAYGFNWIFGDTQSNYVGGYLVSNPVVALSITDIVTPKMLSPTKDDFALGINPFGFDWDSSAPGVASGAPGGFGASSFFASVTNNGGAASGYRTLRISPATLFGHPVTVADIKSMLYQTNKPAAASGIDWRYSIYTPLMPSNNAGSWYGNRIQSRPSGSLNLVAPANQWNVWSTDAGVNQLQWNTNRTGFTTENILWSEMAGGPVTRGSYTYDFSIEPVMLVDIILGANSGGGTGSSQLDAVKFELTSGEVAIIDLAGNTLSLNVPSASIYIQPGESILVDMDVSNLTQKVNGCQAMLGYSSTYFANPAGATVQLPGGGSVWDQIVWDSWVDSTGVPGEIDTAIGVDAQGAVGTQADGTICKIMLTSNTGVAGTTQMVFRADVSDVESTFLSDMSAGPVWPTKVNSANIIIDGTVPADVVITADPVTWTKDSPVTLTFSATDALSGIDHYELQLNGAAFFTATSPYAWDVSALATGEYDATVKAIDKAGNEATASTTVYIDKTNPVASFTAVQNSANVKTGSASATTPVTLQGSVLITVNASDAEAGLGTNPVTVAVAGVTTDAVAGSAGVYTCTATIDAATANGSHEITVTVTDNAGNVQTLTDWIFVDKNQATGSVQLESYVGSSRTVTFVATGGAATKTWTQTLSFVSGVASYTLTNVPEGTTGISAKTAWSLRNKLAVTMTNGQAVANFTGAEMLLGGDLNGTNTINILDYSVLKNNWYTTNPVADIDGNGSVMLNDYSILKANFFKAGDVQ